MPRWIPKNPELKKEKQRKALCTWQFFDCIVCEKKLWRTPSRIRKWDCKFCSRDCYFVWQKWKTKIVRNPYPKKGSNNPNWKWGVATENIIIRRSNEYAMWRESVFKRDDWTCRKCSARSKKDCFIKIEAHHIKPFATFPELRFSIDNGMTLCKKCHSLEPKWKEIWNIR